MTRSYNTEDFLDQRVRMMAERRERIKRSATSEYTVCCKYGELIVSVSVSASKPSWNPEWDMTSDNMKSAVNDTMISVLSSQPIGQIEFNSVIDNIYDVLGDGCADSDVKITIGHQNGDSVSKFFKSQF